jgi:DNA-binding CsgD family transcriptional regulator
VRQLRDVGLLPLFDIRGGCAEIVASDRWARVVASLKLSPRERQIVECVLSGVDSEPEIAGQLAMSSRTVHTHVERLYRKLGVSSRSQLLAVLLLAYATASDGQADT